MTPEVVSGLHTCVHSYTAPAHMNMHTQRNSQDSKFFMRFTMTVEITITVCTEEVQFRGFTLVHWESLMDGVCSTHVCSHTHTPHRNTHTSLLHQFRKDSGALSSGPIWVSPQSFNYSKASLFPCAATSHSFCRYIRHTLVLIYKKEKTLCPFYSF